MKTEIIGYLLGNLTLGFIIAFYIFAILGVIYSMLTHYREKTKKQKVKFDLWFWVKDSLMRLFAVIISIFLVARFANYFEIPIAVDMPLAFITGLYSDKLIIFVRNKTNINIFQAK